MEPEWLRVAYAEMRRGVREVPGPDHSARILAYHATTTLGSLADEIPWCAAFVGWCLEQCGVASTRSAAARSYLDWGVGVSIVHPPIGAVAVLRRGDSPVQGHVGFFWGHSAPGSINLLGGNQSDAVTISTYPIHRLLGMRWLASEG